MNNWQPIETAPKDGTTILLYDPSRVQHSFTNECLGFWADRLYDDLEWIQDDSHETVIHPTHWMPLPEPPEVQE